MRKKIVVFLMSCTLAFGLCACGGGNEEVIPDITEEINQPEQEEVEEETVVEEETRDGMYRSELTNEWIDDSLRNQRPIAVMVDNEKTAVPH